MNTYAVTSAQCLDAVIAWRGAECAPGEIYFGLSSTERMMTSHATEQAKKLNYKQITAIHDVAIVAPNKSATKLRHNLENASPEKHIAPSHLRSIQRRVHRCREELTIRETSVSGKVPETIGQVIEWCESLLLEHHLQRHNDPADEYCLDLHTTYVLGNDIKDMRAMIHFNLVSPYFIFNVVLAMKT